ncbi:unnamed protein product [Pleuronectes platessa]|uniref:Uncharacterized protein n=1 Tax=Pleuronectes platessa TaxID=8262 RepID=A0A9N7Z511_PLEPL|nr:unnamed protein product [Pleuronectes platessa]
MHNILLKLSRGLRGHESGESTCNNLYVNAADVESESSRDKRCRRPVQGATRLSPTKPRVPQRTSTASFLVSDSTMIREHRLTRTFPSLRIWSCQSSLSAETPQGLEAGNKKKAIVQLTRLHVSLCHGVRLGLS